MYGNYQPSTGSFAGFDLNEPTSRDGGKPAVINQVCMYTIVGIIVVHGDFLYLCMYVCM